MVTAVTARNSSQKLGVIVLTWDAPVITGSDITLYTCPVGKQAKLIGYCRCDNTGAATTADLILGGLPTAEWQATGGVTDINTPQNLAENTQYPFEQVLDAGGTIRLTQSSGTNADFNGCVEIQERPA